ncbi:MAG: hypothetical protein ACD_68C00090G0002 [uncultured bacterium]|nr:MAG: hypothetical protein ACD_68C00090G0002 [uncultured bacterium]
MSIGNKVSSFFKESYIELRKVAWPTREETIRHTLIVIGVSLSVTIILGALDFLFTYLAELVFI